jgi:hypothetical protein
MWHIAFSFFADSSLSDFKSNSHFVDKSRLRNEVALWNLQKNSFFRWEGGRLSRRLGSSMRQGV